LPPACSAPWHFPDDVASDETSVNRSLEQALGRCADEWRRAGVLLEAYNTAENAADVADLVRALGTPKARLVGISYGTFLGFAILRDHAGLIESAVFAGTEGPDHTVKLPTQADAVLAGLSRRFESRSPPFELEASVRRVFRSLNQAPVNVRRRDGSNQVVSLYDAQMVTAFLMATSENAERLPSLFAAMDRGDFSGMAQSVLRLRQFFGVLPAMPVATDGASTVSRARAELAKRLVGRSLFGNAVNFPSADLAKALKISPLPARFHQPIRTKVPALFISGDLDSRTPPGNAEAVRRGFTTSTHLVVSGGGHDNDLFLATPLIMDRIESFFDGVRLHDEKLVADPSRLAGSP
jgi:pimeloyl-ACP methyl ester carboxylesterase